MLALGIRYLCGWAMATHPANRANAEWPPHPDRVFMALAAAHFEDDLNDQDRRTLEWLEQLGPPDVAASGATARSSVTSYVPVNDASPPRFTRGVTESKLATQIATARAVLPETRPRQARQFPVTVPHEPTVYLIWPGAQPDDGQKNALTGLCRKVPRLGHSASLVQMWVEEQPPTATLIPDPRATLKLRVTTAGRLRALEASFVAGLRPSSSLWQSYATPTFETPPTVGHSIFSPDLVVLARTGGRPLDLTTTGLLIATLRNAVMSVASEPLPEWLSGHQSDGRPSAVPHVAFVPLAYVGGPYADGHVLGAALVVPRNVDRNDMRRVLGPVIRRATSTDGLRVFNGALLDVTFVLGVECDAARTLRPETWTAIHRPARRWATVTPIALDRYPKREGDAEASIRLACERVGLPRPVEIGVTGVARIRGVPIAAAFAPLRAGAGPVRFHVHAVITFEEPVIGPVVLGAGRYRGYGLCSPIWGDSDDV